MTDTSAEKPNEICRFCTKETGIEQRIFIKGKLGFAVFDRHPVSEGHFLVIPYRHFPEYFDITDAEREELWLLVEQGKKVVEERFSPDGYNIGINVGVAAGQSVPHLHIHVMPRYEGDCENPKGGVRAVIASKKLYTLKD